MSPILLHDESWKRGYVITIFFSPKKIASVIKISTEILLEICHSLLN